MPTDTTVRDKIAKKIRALQTRTTDRGCTEAEALTAAAVAAKLMAEHDLTMTDVEIGEIECRAVHIDTKRKMAHEVQNCTSAIAYFTDAKGWQSRRTGTVHIVFFGRRSDTDFAVYLYEVIKAAMDHELSAFKFSSFLAEGPTGRRESHSFLLGMARRLNKRLRALKDAQEASTRASTGRSLMIVKAHALNQQFANLGISLHGVGHSISRSHAAFAAGQDAGNSVGFNRPIGSDGGASGHLLTRK